MSDTVIKVENLSKQYRLGLVGTGTLSHDLNRFWARVRGKEDPYSKIGDVNDRTTKTDSDYVWALKDINFEVKKGEVLGIIGKNGAGKSTLLKILSRVTTPTTGSVRMKGRVGSLLEVGTGFHPELTGRENVYLNGAILGMRKWEIDKKLDEIVDFSGVEKYLDTPVKRYSSGMKVRLGFAVAAHLEPEILIVDEVLAVGDSDFQTKCLGKMEDVSKNHGRTILFVSHNLPSITSLCSRALLVDRGVITLSGDTSTVIADYLIGNTRKNRYSNLDVKDNGILSCSVGTEGDVYTPVGLPTVVDISFKVEKSIKDFGLALIVTNENGSQLLSSEINDCLNIKDLNLEHGKVLNARVTIPSHFFNLKCYKFRISLGDNLSGSILDSAEFQVNYSYKMSNLIYKHRKKADLVPLFKWDLLD